MLKPPCDAHEAFLRLRPNLKEISGLVSDRRWSSGERQRLADMLLGYFLGWAVQTGRLASGSQRGTRRVAMARNQAST
jgi:hypothetical protein